MSIFARGLVLGFSIAAPVGPIGVLCIRRTMADGRAIGFVSGLGAATADAIYAAVAAFGLTIVSTALLDAQHWLRLIGGCFLCYLGIRTFLATPTMEGRGDDGRGLLGSYASTFALTLTNPMTILSFTANFAGLGVTAAGRYSPAVLLVAGVFCGSGLW
jgi:threonine/homoserine/homoserine lactone efflux protein